MTGRKAFTCSQCGAPDLEESGERKLRRMKVVDLPDDRRDLFCLCLEDWSEEARESGPKRREWLDGRSLQKGPPPSFEKIRKALAKRVARLGK